MKKQPEDLKIRKPLSLYPMKFDEAVDILLATKPKRLKAKQESREGSLSNRPSGEFAEKVIKTLP